VRAVRRWCEPTLRFSKAALLQAAERCGELSDGERIALAEAAQTSMEPPCRSQGPRASRFSAPASGPDVLVDLTIERDVVVA